MNNTLATRYAAYKEHGSYAKAAKALGMSKEGLREYLVRNAQDGKLGTEPVLPGFAIKSIASKQGDAWVRQTREHGAVFEVPEGHVVKGVSALVDADGRVIQEWRKTGSDADTQSAMFRAMVDALKEELPRCSVTPAPEIAVNDLLNQYVITDSHFGMMAWREETGADYDLKIAEKLLLDWFSSAIAASPKAHTAVFAQLGDLMHHDSLESVTPAHKHVLDADSRLQKIIRVVVRTVRRIINMLLQTHKHVHIIMASGNHDPASSAWLRELLAAMYENEPRISVDNSPMLYYAYEWGNTALFFHHGHKRSIQNVDVTLAGLFREMYGRSKYAYAHIGHLHSDEGKKGNLMYVERHETLASPDAYAAGGGWISGRSAKRITYSKRFGEVARDTIRPEMVMGEK